MKLKNCWKSSKRIKKTCVLLTCVLQCAWFVPQVRRNLCLVNLFGADVYGTKARIIRIEADVSDGLPVFDMVGFLASAVKEARERVRIAVRQMGIRFPAKRITVNLSPANVRKEGTTFDLPIAICLLTAFGHLSKECIKDTMFIGELGLDGSVQSVNGVLAMVLEGKKQGLRQFLVPKGNVKEAAVLEGISLYGVESLSETLRFFTGEKFH